MTIGYKWFQWEFPYLLKEPLLEYYPILILYYSKIICLLILYFNISISLFIFLIYCNNNPHPGIKNTYFPIIRKVSNTLLFWDYFKSFEWSFMFRRMKDLVYCLLHICGWDLKGLPAFRKSRIMHTKCHFPQVKILTKSESQVTHLLINGICRFQV